MIAPKCPICGDVAPYGDARNNWLGWHESWLHRTAWRVSRWWHRDEGDQ